MSATRLLRAPSVGRTLCAAGLGLLLALPVAAQVKPRLKLDDVVSPKPELLKQPARFLFAPDGQVLEIKAPPLETGGFGVERIQVCGLKPQQREFLTDADKFVEALKEVGVEWNAARGFPRLTMVGQTTFRFALGGAVWHWTVGEKPNKVLPLFTDAARQEVAPGDLAVAAIRDGNLWIRRAGQEPRQITTDGKDGVYEYGGSAHRSEFGITDGLFWSADGTKLAFSREDFRPIALLPRADYSKLPAKPLEYRYPMAGRAHSIVRIGVLDIAGGAKNAVYLEADDSQDIYWTNVAFTPENDEVWVAQVARNQKQSDLVAFDADTGKRLRKLFTETDEEWVEPEHAPFFLADGETFLWMSSRDGVRHLWRHRRDNGEQLWRETTGDFDLRSVQKIQAIGDEVFAYVMAAGGNDPRLNLLWRCRLGRPLPIMSRGRTGPKMEQITVPPGWHEVQIGPQGQVIDSWSNVYQPGIVELIQTNRRRLFLGYRNRNLASYTLGTHVEFQAKADDGSDLYGDVILPPGAPQPLKKYPVILYVYGGPHVQLVRNTWRAGANLWMEYMASRGFAVVRLDNRGTPGRGRDFEQATFRHLGELEALDQIAGLEALKPLMPYLDMDRVGVHGWSFGGYMTLRLMTLFPERFKAGVSGAPVTDWLQYETGYTERYMDSPVANAEGYEYSAVMPFLDSLQGELLLVHGTDDVTVVPSHSMSLLMKAVELGKPIDFMAYPQQAHGLRGKSREHFLRKLTKWFEDKLLTDEERARLTEIDESGF